MTDRPHLRSLADRVGILPAYHDIAGIERITHDDTRVLLLAAMGLDGSTEQAAMRALWSLGYHERNRLIEPVRVITARSRKPPTVTLAIPRTDSADHECLKARPVTVDWRIELRTEEGFSHVTSGRSQTLPGNRPDARGGNDPGARQPGRSIIVSLPAALPLGYHVLRATVECGGGVFEAEQSLIVFPGRCHPLSERMGGRRGYGLWTNLYTLRSPRNWGIGDVTDLGDLAREVACRGADFVGLNPLHTIFNLGEHISPYCPVSRLFRNPIYIDVEAVPEFSESAEARARLSSPAFQEKLASARSAKLVDYDGVGALKTEIMHLLHDVFLAEHAAEGSRRGIAYARYVAAGGKPLLDFATFMALDEWLRERGENGGHWRKWPKAYRRPDTPQVRVFRSRHRREVDFHSYLQFELERQLAAADDQARRAGMRLGLYHDLAVGSADDGSDAWAFPDLFAAGVEVGAPPDPYSDVGQTWGFPPVDPHRLRAGRYEYWIRLVQSSLACGGMLRIDHVMGLFRQFWVPKGLPATQGAYVRYPAEDLLGILALESQRRKVVIVGEDLGTVPPEVPSIMARRDILSSRVMYFERDHEGGFNPSGSYSPRALVTATNHDHPPLPGFWTGRDLEIRHRIGLIRSPQDLEQAREQRERARVALLARLFAEGFSLDRDTCTPDELCAAVHAFLTHTPCPLVGISLDDLAGETEPVNIPGVALRQYRSWSRRMGPSVEVLVADPGVWEVLEDMRVRLCDAKSP